MSRLSRLMLLATLPETRRALHAATQSAALRDAARMARHDRAGLLRALRHPGSGLGLARGAIRHPATRELANAGLLFLPARYVPLGWAASKATHRLLRRYIEPPAADSGGTPVPVESPPPTDALPEAESGSPGQPTR